MFMNTINSIIKMLNYKCLTLYVAFILSVINRITL